MKRKVKIWFPVQSTYEDEIEVDIPDGENPEEWVRENAVDLIDGHWMWEGTHLETALDFDAAGAKLLPAPDGEGRKEEA